MAKNESILLRVSAKEKEFIRRQAKKRDMNMTEYIFWCVDSHNSHKVIVKSELAPHVIKLASALDCAETKDARTVKDLRKKFKKIWDLL